VRTGTDDLIIYEPFHFTHKDSTQSFTTNLRWRKINQPHMPKYEETEDFDPGESGTLKPLRDIGGYSTVFQAGTSPCFVLKESTSIPRVVSMRVKGVQSISSFHTASCERGFLYVDLTGAIRASQLPRHFRYGDTGWPTRKIPMNEEVQALCYHPPKQVYAFAASTVEAFKLPDDDFHYEWTKEDTDFPPQTERGAVRLLHPQTSNVVDSYVLDPYEVVLCMKTIDLEVSEVTHKRQQLIVVGTAILQGEDLPASGTIHVLDVISVVPEPGRPETGMRFKPIAREEVKGAVTALSSIGSQGFLLAAQGQKCMVRGLKEDGTLLPVAFMDMQTHTTVAKALPGTGMAIMGDAIKGLWFSAYTEEPYKMMLLGKSRTQLEVVTAEFLPEGKNLFVMIADADCNIHILQYDPERKSPHHLSPPHSPLRPKLRKRPCRTS